MEGHFSHETHSHYILDSSIVLPTNWCLFMGAIIFMLVSLGNKMYENWVFIQTNMQIFSMSMKNWFYNINSMLKWCTTANILSPRLQMSIAWTNFNWNHLFMLKNTRKSYLLVLIEYQIEMNQYQVKICNESRHWSRNFALIKLFFFCMQYSIEIS